MSRRRLLRVALALLALTGLITFRAVEQGSLERANRLQREGRSEEAVQLYEARTRASPSDPELRYNLGTALAALGSPEAQIELSRASPAGTPEIRGRALYNTGLLNLELALEATDPDSVHARAAAAIGANRTALRLRPDDVDAKWNLALALRLLDSIRASERRSGRELTDGAVEADVVTRSVNVPDAAEDEHRAEDPPAEGERETVAVVGEESPLTPEEAAGILGRSHLEPTEMLAKLLSLEGRGRWGRPSGSGVRRW